jgi:hypothetical protein
MTTIEGKSTTFDKVLYTFLALLVLAIIAYVPFMMADKQATAEKEWKEKGCRMYDAARVSEIPAKCSNDFVDHYKSQELK